MLKELSKYNNLGTPSYFSELVDLLNHNKTITEQEIKDYFFNRTIDNRQIFDGCLSLLETLNIINVNKITNIVCINSNYNEIGNSFELLKEKILESFFKKYGEDAELLNIFDGFIFDDSYPNTILIEASSFKLKFMNVKRFLVDFNFLIIHPDESNYFINKTYVNLFDKYIMSQFNKTVAVQKLISEPQETPPKVFISYSWDNDDHKAWVLNLANELAKNGVEPILDRFELNPGANAPYFMERAIDESDKVLIIFTENYNLKATHRKGGVGVEYSILNAEICKNITDNKKYIPILRNGTSETSIPPFLQQLIAIYMQDDSKYDEQLKVVLHSVFEKPLIPKPKIGNKPDYLK